MRKRYNNLKIKAAVGIESANQEIELREKNKARDIFIRRPETCLQTS